MAVAITAAAQDSWPPRALVSVTGLTVSDVVTIYRQVAGQRTAVRGAVDVEMTDTSLVRVDAEAPFGVPLTYVAVVDDTDEHEADPLTLTLTGGKVALTDAISGQAAEVVIMAWPERQRSRRASVYAVGGRNVVVSGPLGQATGQIELYTDADSSRENLHALLEAATGGIVQLRQPGGYEGVDCYLGVLGVAEQRWSQDGTDPRRRWALDAAEVDPWPAELEARGFTLQDLADAYDGLTLDDLEDDYSTLLGIAEADLS